MILEKRTQLVQRVIDLTTGSDTNQIIANMNYLHSVISDLERQQPKDGLKLIVKKTQAPAELHTLGLMADAFFSSENDEFRNEYYDNIKDLL